MSWDRNTGLKSPAKLSSQLSGLLDHVGPASGEGGEGLGPRGAPVLEGESYNAPGHS